MASSRTSAAIALVVALLSPVHALALNARLSWSPVPSAAGYKIYVRPSAGVYGVGVDVGPQTAAADGIVHFTVANVAVGALLAVSTYDAKGIESARSNELALTALPPTATLTPIPVRTATQTAVPTRTPVATATAVATVTATPTATIAATATPTPRPTATSTAVPPTRTAVATTTPVSTATPTAVPTRTPVATATAVATVTATPTATIAATATPTPRPTATSTTVPPTRTAVPTIVPTRTAVPTMAATRTAGPTIAATPAPVDPLADLSALGAIIARVTAPRGGGNHDIEIIRDGDQPPAGSAQSSRQYDTYDGRNVASEDWIGYGFTAPQRFRQVVFQEGRHFWNGGWFEGVRVQVRQNGAWTDIAAAPVPAYPGVNTVSYETFRWSFEAITGDAIRIYGQPGGQDAFISVAELRVFGDGAPATPGPAGADVSADGSIVARVVAPTGGGNHDIEVIRDHDMPPAGTTDSLRQYDTYDGANTATEDWIGYEYQAPLSFRRVLFQEGRHFWDGGWFETLGVQVRQNGVWKAVSGATVTPAYPGVNARTYETFVFDFPAVTGDGIRIYGRPGGMYAFISVGELRAFADASPVATPAVAPAAVGGAAIGAETGVVATVAARVTSTRIATPAAIATATPAAETTAVPTPSPVCGDGSRAGSESCDGVDDASCPGHCRVDCACAVVVELPLEGWSALGGDIGGAVAADPATGAPVLAVTDSAPTDGAALAYPASPTLDLALPQLAVTARASAPFTVAVLVRASSGGTYELAYRAADGAGGRPTIIEGTRAVFAVGGSLAAGEVGTIYRDLGADLHAAFGATFAAAVQARAAGTLELSRVALASDRGRDEDTAARVALPLAGWGQHGSGTVTEHVADPTLPGLTMRAVPSTRSAQRLQLTYPPAQTTALEFGTLALAVRDPSGLVVEVSGVTSGGDDVELTYELGRTSAQSRLRRATLPLPTRARAPGPWMDIRLDLAGDVAALDTRVSLAAVTSVRLRGAFTAGDVQLRDPIVATPVR